MWTTMVSHFRGPVFLSPYTRNLSSSSSIPSSRASSIPSHLPIPVASGARAPLPTSGTKLSPSTTPSDVPTGNYRRLSATVSPTLICHSSRRKAAADTAPEEDESDDLRRTVIQALLWGSEAVYILWLLLLPYAPGDPVWAISSETVNSLIGLSLNFFFILPLMNSVGISLIDAPVLHPMSEGLFNFVIGWTFMFAPLLFTDCRRNRYKGSLDVLWGLQMFLTNVFLIPYMAIRLNGIDNEDDSTPRKPSQLGLVMTRGGPIVGLIGGGICLISTLWAIFARGDSGFGDLTERADFLVRYLGSERLAYAFIWDILLYTIFQPWLIGDNLQNVQRGKVAAVSFLRFVPVVGLAAYLLCLNPDEKL
ncbi:hypothetical protein SAY86_020076 [Trapa natans]|uniref:Transmembrane protein n=1 Tax=Trapa natans TaxID=22666 RepID=A0AAN7LLY2_TRANT|nr:hypothetical protein SAY86_020076 [Trapa natans]